jgi:hypothetical protein
MATAETTTRRALMAGVATALAAGTAANVMVLAKVTDAELQDIGRQMKALCAEYCPAKARSGHLHDATVVPSMEQAAMAEMAPRLPSARLM